MDRSKWEYRKLGEVATFVGGGTPSKAKEEYYTGNIPWATVRDMTNFCLSQTELSITEQAVKESATNIIPKDTIIISTHVGLGKICLLMQDTAINQDLKGVILPSTIDKMYFAAWYKSISDYIVSNGKGATVKGVTMKFVNDLSIPLPPVADQQRIVAELDCLNEMIAVKQEQLKEFDKLAQSIFYDMFGDPSHNEKQWVVKSLKDISNEKLSYGSGASAVTFDGRIRYIRITDIKDNGELNDDIVSPSVYDEKYLLNDGDILFARSGATVGKTYCHNNKYGRCIYAGYLIRLVPNKELVLPSYIYSYTKTPYYRSFVEAAQRAVAQPNINAKQYGDLLICVPPLALQQQFAEKISAIEAQKELVKQSIAETQALLDYTMDKFFG